MTDLSVYTDGRGNVTGDQLNSFVQCTTAATDLRGFTGVSGMQVAVTGATTANDGGSGNFYWNANGTGPDDGYNVIVPYGVTLGCWVRETFLFGQAPLVAFPFILASTLNSAPAKIMVGTPASPVTTAASGLSLEMFSTGGTGADWSNGAAIIAAAQLQGGNSTGGGGVRVAFFETTDALGNPTLPASANQYYTETLRLMATVAPGVNFTNTQALIACAYTPDTPLFMAHATSIESLVANTSAFSAPSMEFYNGAQSAHCFLADVGDASGSFNPIDAAYATNEYCLGQAQTGFFVAPNSVIDVAFGTTDTCAWGLRTSRVTFAVVGGANNISMLRQLNGAGTDYLSLIGMNASDVMFLANDPLINGVSIGNGAADIILTGLKDCVDDAAAAAAGVPVNAQYRNGSAMMFRVS